MTERLSLIVLEAVRRLGTLDFKREEGQGVTEYGIVLAFVAVALAAVLIVLKGKISDADTWNLVHFVRSLGGAGK